jgi:hypothetical protein
MTMEIKKFGEALIKTRDLDPVYCAIHGAQLPADQLRRLLIAYWCFYHLGSAAHISEQRGAAFWSLMMEAARNERPAPDGGRWPRASERRHFRGHTAVNAVTALSKATPESWVHRLEDYRTETEIMDEVRTWPFFGPWIAFKAADMMERVVGTKVKFSQNIGLMYDAPRAGLALLASGPSDMDAQYAGLMKHFAKFSAPPGHDRPCGAQEVETILCKWKSHTTGHYEIGKDCAEVRHALTGGWGKTADKLMKSAPELVEMELSK